MREPSFSAPESSILEIPMTISDVFHADPINAGNYPQKVAQWTDATQRYVANNSPVVLLIHPNRTYKLWAQQDYVNQLDPDVLIYSFEGFGDFWKKRDVLDYHTVITGNEMMVTIDDSYLVDEQSFVIDFDGLNSVAFENQIGIPLYFDWIDWDYDTRLYYRIDEPSPSSLDELDNQITVYPNPTAGQIFVSGYEGPFQLIDVSGKICLNGLISKNKPVKLSDLKKGVYILELGNFTKKIVLE